MTPERNRDGNFTKARQIHGEINMWSAAQRQKDPWLLLACLINHQDEVFHGFGQHST